MRTTRWGRLPPGHGSPWRAWLTYPHSLTRRIVERSGAFRVELLSQRLRLPDDDEYAVLGRPRNRLAFVREVRLHADGRPVVLAHSVVAPRDVAGCWRAVKGLGTRPLAEVLFADPRVRRAPFEYARLAAPHPLWREACRLEGGVLPALWARRSVFRRDARPLMVTEVFLPALARLVEAPSASTPGAARAGRDAAR